MESDLGKLFIGGISWDTDENRLREYFGQYGQVMEVVIMRDRITGRARGFGFIVFADPSVAERVVMDKHMIDGRTVEAKKAVPRDDQQILSRKNNTIQGRTKKIFVGGLASTVTESDFKQYFDQFGTIADVVVMYDHNTQRPRGFGFITFDSEDAVDRVLHKTFHELNGKMVEVKRAVPKELSPSPSRSPLVGYNYNINRANNLINGFPQGYNLSSIGGYNRINPLITGRSELPPFGNPRYGMGMNMEPGLGGGYGVNSPLNKSQSYGRVLGPYYDGNSNRFNMPIGYNGGNIGGDSLVSPTARNLWGNGSIGNPTNPGNPGAFLGSPSGNFGASFRDRGASWGTTSAIPQVGDNAVGYNNSGNFGYGFGDGNHGLRGGGYARTQLTDRVPEPLAASTGGFDSTYGDLNRGGSAYLDSSWGSRSTELDSSGSFGFGLGTTAVDVASKTPEGFIGSYSVTNRQANRGIAA